jgi:hypothetical protein
MPFPSPETVLINRLFDAHTVTIPRTNTHTAEDDEAALRTFDFGLKRLVTHGSVSGTDSPTSSSSTLVLEDDEIKRIFASHKPTFDMDRTPRPNVHPYFNFPAPRSRSGSIDELNPNAKEFVPSIRPGAAPRSRQLLRPTPGPGVGSRVPRWMRTFGRAIKTTTVPEQEPLAQIIVVGEAWESHTMADLAQAFAWRGAEDIPMENECVAALAKSVYQKFRIMKSEDTAETFLWHLKEAVLGTYINVWDAVSILLCWLDEP